MEAFGTYVAQLEELFAEATSRAGLPEARERIDAALDGQPGHELRRLVGLETQRATGAFFTGSALAEKALSPLAGTINRRSIILDPASGAGDLLVAATKHLEPASGFRSTAADWGRQLIGRDLHPEFVRAARIRLGLAILSRGIPLRRGEASWERLFPHVRVGSGIGDADLYSRVTHIVMNPPFTMIPAPDGCRWGGGKVSAAAVFLDACLDHARAGTRILAILPDVLRSGSRYGAWRSQIEGRATPRHLQLLGQFDRWADVDVFSLELEVSRSSTAQSESWGYPTTDVPKTVADLFMVRVGRVVPYRDVEDGPRYRYIHSRNLRAWEVDSEATEWRRYAGEPFKPPFVAVRRTSRFGQQYRAVGTIVIGEEPVAVENHLLVITPIDRSLARCHELISVLRSPRSTQWFDQRIRCRHLTVVTLRQLPWREDGR